MAASRSESQGGTVTAKSPKPIIIVIANTKMILDVSDAIVEPVKRLLALRPTQKTVIRMTNGSSRSCC
jgi:hypothetical protein